MSPDPVVSIRDLSFSYDRTKVLDRVDFDIEARDFVSVIGPNGGGKTTLLKLMLGELQPQGGRIRIFGESPSRVLKRIGYVPQHMQIDPLFPMTTSDMVGTGSLGSGRLWGPLRRREKEAITQAMADTGTLEFAKMPFSELSGGQRQRVMIARALSGRPDLLLLDEPTASLDPGIGQGIYALLKELNARMTIVMVSHDVNMVSQHVNRVFCVNVHLVEHCAAEIIGDLEQFFPRHRDMRLVRHAHDHSRRGVNHD